MSGQTMWLLAHLIKTGVMSETGLTRKARPKLCHSCGVWTIAGLDGEWAALDAVCDPRPLTPGGEAYVWLRGLRTWDLVESRGRFELEPRTSYEIARHPAGSRPRVDVLAQHHCYVSLRPEWFGPSSFPEVTPPVVGDVPPF